MSNTYSIGCRSAFPTTPRLFPFARQGLLFEARETELQQHDPWPEIVGDALYMFYAYYDGIGIGISYASCSLADYISAPTNLVRHGSWVVAPDPGGLGDVFHTAPCLFHLPGGGWFMFAHVYKDGRDRGFLDYCSESEFPNTWHKYGIVLDSQGEESWIHNQSFVPPWESPSGLWECVYATCPDAGGPWVARRATSPDGYTWTRHGIVMSPTGASGDFDRLGVHPLGKIYKFGDVFVGTYQGYDGVTWRPGMYATRDFVRFWRSPYGSIWQPSSSVGAYDHGSIESPTLFAFQDQIQLLANTSLVFVGGETPGTGGGYDYQIAWATLTP